MQNLSGEILHRELEPYCNPLADPRAGGTTYPARGQLTNLQVSHTARPLALRTVRKRNILMARRTVLVDDFDESKATQTVQLVSGTGSMPSI